jgi:RNA polymerase primary sigma factor
MNTQNKLNMINKQSVIPINQDEVSYYLKDIRKIKVMTPERERELSKLMQSENVSEKQKESIKKEILEGNLRFVITVAKQYQNQGVDFPDLVAEGNIGLMKALNNFDWTKNLRFISYAVWWVRQSILQSLNEHSRTIRIPVNVVQDLHKEKKRVEKTDGRMEDRFANLPYTINLETQINEEGDTLIDLIENKNSMRPDEVFNTSQQLKDGLINILNILDEREKQIVEDYYGISGTPRTLEDIGSDFNLTKERVRQIKEKALRKLRNESSSLFDYI